MVARVALLASLLIAVPAAAQNWSTDARRIALGGVGDARNPALELVEEQRGYGTIILPFGLFQVLQDFSIYEGLSRSLLIFASGDCAVILCDSLGGRLLLGFEITEG